MKHEKCYLCLRTRVTLVPGSYTTQGGGFEVGVQFEDIYDDDYNALLKQLEALSDASGN